MYIELSLAIIVKFRDAKAKIFQEWPRIIFFFTVHIFWEGHKILKNLHLRVDRYYIGQIYSGDFQKFVASSEYMNFTKI